MSVKMALEFIRQGRADESLRRQLQMLGLAPSLEDVLQVARQAGYDLTIEEMRTAFKHDWGMRWMYFGGGTTAAQLASNDSKDDGQRF